MSKAYIYLSTVDPDEMQHYAAFHLAGPSLFVKGPAVGLPRIQKVNYLEWAAHMQWCYIWLFVVFSQLN